MNRQNPTFVAALKFPGFPLALFIYVSRGAGETRENEVEMVFTGNEAAARLAELQEELSEERYESISLLIRQSKLPERDPGPETRLDYRRRLQQDPQQCKVLSGLCEQLRKSAEGHPA